MNYLLFYIASVIIFSAIFDFVESKLELLVHQFPMDMVQEDANNSGWISTTGIMEVITCSDGRKFGPYGGVSGVNLQRTFYLPPHWSLSVAFEAYMLWDWEASDTLTVSLDSDIIYQKQYSQNIYTNKHYCDGSTDTANNKDMRVPVGVNFTHAADQILLKFEANLSGSQVSEALAISNLYIHYDSCFYTCLTCSGPAYNQCDSCPSNSVFSSNQCICDENYIMLDNQCQTGITCPAGRTEDDNIRVCVESCQVKNCLTCPNFYLKQCLQCKSGYNLVNNQYCHDQCPFYTTSSTGNICTDTAYESLQRPYILAQEFSDIDFSHANVQSTGWSYSKFDSQTIFTTSTSVSSYAANKCNMKTLAAGFGFLPENDCNGPNCSFSRSFTNLSPHFQLKIRLQLWAGGKWANEQFQIKLDGIQVHTQNYQFVDSTPTRDFYCGNDFYIQNYIFDIDLDYILHDSTTLNIEFVWDISSKTSQAWAGFRDFQILIEQCENSNCGSCSGTGQTCLTCKGSTGQVYSRDPSDNCSCPPGYENLEEFLECQTVVCEGSQGLSSSRDNLDGCVCPDTYYSNLPSNIECQECKYPCENCETSSINCLSCYDGENRYEPPSCNCISGYYQDIKNKCIKCPNGCSSCTSEDDCQDEKKEEASFFETYWYIIGIAALFFILFCFFCYKAYTYQSKNGKSLKVIHLNLEKQQEEEKQSELLREKQLYQKELDKQRQPPQNRKTKKSFNFNIIPTDDKNFTKSRKNFDLDSQYSQPQTERNIRAASSRNIPIDQIGNNTARHMTMNKRDPFDSPGGFQYGQGTQRKQTLIYNHETPRQSQSPSRVQSRAQSRQGTIIDVGNTTNNSPRSQYDRQNSYRHTVQVNTFNIGAAGQQNQKSRFGISKQNL